MGMSTGGSEEFNSEINVTPMVDIMLVLLIIFMVITPLLQQGVTVNLPRDMDHPDEDANITKDGSVVISIPNNDQFYIGKEGPLAREVLGEKVKKLTESKTKENKIVYIKAGVAVDFGSLVEAINVIRKQDVDKIGLVADKKKGSKPSGT
jgi:biopolymer transport protein ExbD/biopolymer transport protein TolR